MASKVQICNLALSQIGKGSIQDLEENTSEAIACELVYDAVLQALLEQYEWNFAIKEAKLALVDGVRFQEWDYVYAYPADCLSARCIPNQYSPMPVEFRVMVGDELKAKYIAASVPNVSLQYIANVTDPGMLPATFVAAFALKLAMALSPLLVSGTDPAKTQQLLTYYQQVALPEALAANAREGYVAKKTNNPIIDARG